jgi:integrase
MVEQHKNIGDISATTQGQEETVWSLFLYAMKSPVTRQKYAGKINKFFDFLELDGTTTEQKSMVFLQRAQQDGNAWVFSSILRFMRHLLERYNRKEITGSTVRNYLKSIKLFCEMADISINWKKISRGLPKGKNYADDRIPSDEEIQKILDYPDRRIKAIVYTMISSGIRLGAWEYLKWGHIRPIQKDNEILAAKIIVYAGEEEEYFSFISREAYLALNDWMKYREKNGEIINNNSWLMRDLWNTGAVQGGKGLVTIPNKLAASGIKRLIERAIWAQGLRKKLENGKKRHPFQAVHSFRKWFKTRCEIGGMKPINVEKLLAHSIGISDSYYRPTENELLEDYLKVVNLLSVDKETQLQEMLTTYKENTTADKDVIRRQLQEKDYAIQKLNEEFSVLKSMVENMVVNLDKISDENSLNNIAKSLFSVGLVNKLDKRII